ncbi:MAG: hypothetical protein CMK59_03060 [Proteobacteria bacterium]|nr:hypothetical protein [Pseudomonadota bacterium]
MNNLFRSQLKDFKPRLNKNPTEAFSAVAILICGKEHQEQVLMFQRAQRSGDPWSGHIAFPGGRKEEQDESLWHTAVRETREEMGVFLEHAEYLGRLNDLHHPKIMVSAFVFYMSNKPDLNPNYEVQRPLWLDLKHIFNKENHEKRNFNTFSGEYILPCVVVDDVIIWGISLSFLSQIESMWS